MANDVNANIRINIDSAQALSELKALQAQISSFNKSVVQTNSAAVAKQRDLLATLQSQIGATKQFSTSIVNVEDSVSRLGRAIDRNKLTLGEYFRFGIASSQRFGKVFGREHTLMTQLATERVKKLQTQYIALGAAHDGVTKSLAIRPLSLFNADAAIAIQRQQLFNKLLRDGSTSLVNFGKNTQWAGRQLMVGFTVPLTIFGGMAAKTFMQLEEQAIAFRKVYGDIFTTDEEVEQNLKNIEALTKEFTKYGISAKDTFELANIAAQAGQRGQELTAATVEATRLGVLGQMEQAEAMRTTLTLQNAFRLSNEELAESVNFLNIVENQSVLSLQDVAAAIPRVAPVVSALGGDVKDLAVMLTAMREGGVTAGEGANALKTSLARLISPTTRATNMANDFGISLKNIVETNQGDILGAVMQLAESMNELDDLSKQRLLSEIFGKQQYARVAALFNNITNEASQSQRILSLTSMSAEELAETAERELGVVEQAISTKFTGALERLKIEIAPLGELFLQIATPIIEFATKAVAKFNELSPQVKKFAAIATVAFGVVTPVLIMLVGLAANFIGNMVKGLSVALNFINRARGAGAAVDYLSNEQLEATAAAASLEGRTENLTNALNIQRTAVLNLARAYQTYVGSATMAASGLPRGFRGPVRRMAKGGMVEGTGNKDSEPALLMPGEFVMNKEATEKYGPILGAMNQGNIKGYAEGSQFAHIGGGQKIGLVDLSNLMRGFPDAFSQGAQKFVNLLANTFGNAVKAIVLPSLGFAASGSINRRMAGRGAPVTREEFLADWDTRGLDRWSESLRRAGLKMDDVQDDLTILETAMRSQISSMDEGAKINDIVMKQIYDEAIEMVPAQSRLKKEFQLLSQTYKEVRVNLRKSMVAGAGLQTEKVGSKEMALIGDQRVKIGGEKRGFTKTGTGVTSAQLVAGGAVGSVIGGQLAGATKAANVGEGVELVDDFVDEIKAGAAANVNEVRQSGALLNSALVSGAQGPSSPYTPLGAETQGKLAAAGQAANRGESLLGDIPRGERMDIQTRQIIPPDLGGELDDIDEKVGKTKKGFGGATKAALGLGAALTVVSGAASMMPGPIGEVAQQFFPLIIGLEGVLSLIPLLSGAGGFGGLTSILGSLGGAAGALLNPITLIAAAIAALVAGLVVAYQRSEGFRTAVNDLFTTIQEMMMVVLEPLIGMFGNFGTVAEKVGGFLGGAFNVFVSMVAVQFTVLAKALQIVFKIWTMLFNLLKGSIKALGGLIGGLLNNMGPVGDAIKGIGQGISDFFSNIPNIISGIWDSILGYVNTQVNNAIDMLNTLIGWYNSAAAVLRVPLISEIENVDIVAIAGQAAGQGGVTSTVDSARFADTGARDSFAQEPTPKTPPEPEPEGGGGEKEKTFLEKLIEDLNANALLYLDAEKGLAGYEKNRGRFFGIFQKLRKKGVSEDIIASLGTGPEAIKNARELLDMSKKELKQLMKDVEAVSLGQVVENARRKAIEDEQKLKATRKAQTVGLSPEQQEIIMADAEMTKAFANAKVGSKEYNALMKVVNRLAKAKKDLADASETEAEKQKKATDAVLEAIQNQIDKMEIDLTQAFKDTHGMLPAEMELEIRQRQRIIAEIEKQITALNELNDTDQGRIDQLNRQKEIISRQIELLERANEMDQRRIETLQRQNEIRSREEDRISKELDILSDQEDKIREAGEKRIAALEKVANINDYIINQQRQQLDLSRAISEGDIYSATAAAQQMRAESGAFSREQLIAGLERGVEGQVAGLRTAEGLTRQQAEQQIANIQQQSYQTSLQIRNIQDQIYDRNQQMIPLKDQQYQLDLQIRDIQDIIYERGQQIKIIQEEQISPLTTQNDIQQGILDKLNAEVDDKTGPLKARYDWYKQQESLNENVRQQTENIAEWTKRGRDRAEELAGKWGSVAANAWEAARAIAAATGAQAGQGAFAGGMIKGYRRGGIVSGMQSLSYGGTVLGSGARDSVSAMLTPGEFVVRKAMVDKYGTSLMEKINQGSFTMPKYNMGETTGEVMINKTNISSINAPVYNTYDMKFAISGTNQSADEIANKVMFKMKQIQDQGIRGNRGY